MVSGTLLLIPVSATAQLNQNCIVSVLNRSVPVNADGSWVLPNIPANFGMVKARATCVQNGVTTFGESAFFSVTANNAVNLPAIILGQTTPIPDSLSLTPASPMLATAGQTVQLMVTAAYPDSSTKDVSAAAAGTNYTNSNPAIATVDANGLVKAVSSGTVVIQANNDGATGITTVRVMLGGSAHGGIPDAWAIAHGLNPNDPLLAMEDPDHDGLTNLEEYQAGTDPNLADTDGDGLNDGDELHKYHTSPLLADTDGDGIPDGVEIQNGTNPLDAKSYDLKKATASFTVTPPMLNFATSIVNPSLGIQLSWKALLIDGKTTLDLTADPRTHYSSSNLNVCNFAEQPGLVFSSAVGNCVIAIQQNSLSVAVPGTVTNFTPTEVSALTIGGSVALDVSGAFVYVATGTGGLMVVDVSDRTKPRLRGSLTGIGDAEAVRVLGQNVLVADTHGFLRVVNVQNPDAPALLASLAIAGAPNALAAHGTLAAVAAGAGGVSLVDVTNPASPVLVSAFSTPAPAIGVDFDLQHSLGGVAMGTAGVQVVDLSMLGTPKLRGLLAGGDVRRVLINYPALLLADFQRSVTAVDITSRDNPTITTSLAGNLGGAPVDIAAVGSIAITADMSFGRAVPVIGIANPLQPSTLLFWTITNPGYGSSIAMDNSFGYLIIPGTLRILKYQNIVDSFGLPPSVQITAPPAGTPLIQGQTVTVSASAADDVAVASVTLLVNGQPVFSTAAQPYQFSYKVPLGATSLTFAATALDYGNNIGMSANVVVPVIPDPGTTVVGKVVDAAGTALGGAAVSTIGPRTAVTASDGTFTILQVPTVQGNIRVTANYLTPTGTTMAGQSGVVPPVSGGTTNVGTITTVLVPVVASLSAKSGLAGSVVTLSVMGSTLAGSTFTLQPASISIQVLSIAADGKSATLSLTIPSTTVGTFVLIATNVAGSSSSAATQGNRFTVVDPNSTADTDGDGIQDGLEAACGTDPLDPNSFPVIQGPTETESGSISVLNAAVSGAASGEAESGPFSLLNALVSGAGSGEAESLSFSVKNALSAGASSGETESKALTVLNVAATSTGSGETESGPFSILNALVSGAGSGETESLSFSVKNALTGAVASGETESKALTVLNVASSSTGSGETESGPFSLLNVPVTASGAGETESFFFGVLNQFGSKVTPSQTKPQPSGTTDSMPSVSPRATAVIDPFLDSDGDGLPDWYELLIGTDPYNPDTDGDGLTDFEEVFVYHTNPFSADTDGDGFSDGIEILLGSDPLDPNSTPVSKQRGPRLASTGPIPTIDVDRNKKPATPGDANVKQHQK